MTRWHIIAALLVIGGVWDACTSSFLMGGFAIVAGLVIGIGETRELRRHERRGHRR